MKVRPTYRFLTSPSLYAQNPAEAGEVVIIFCTGLGQVYPPLASGAPAAGLHTTVLVPTVTIAGLPAEVQFSGLAPGFVGLYQVNVEVPLSIQTSSTNPFVLSIGGKQSNQVTMAVLEEGQDVPPGGDDEY